jgi:hypothetical protein
LNKKYTTEIFIEQAKMIHGEKYDYSKVEYINYNSKLEIVCPVHGSFFQGIEKHIRRKQGCSECSQKKRHTNKSFIKKAKEIHKDLYDYSLVDYKNANTKIKIICKIHGTFEQLPTSHLSGKGCNKCKGNKISNSLFSNTHDFIKKAVKKHENLYDYSLVDYISAHKKVKIICSQHGVFEQDPNSHLNGRGCPNCKKSFGENFIEKFLIDNNINYESQKSLVGCKNKYPLRFDFYLKKHNTVIEFNGLQHYSEIPYYHKGKFNFEYQKEIDLIKKEYCLKNNIKFIEIPYWKKDNIESILIKELSLNG